MAGRPDAESRIEVSCNDSGAAYAVYDTDGELEDSGTEWETLVKRLETELGATQESVSIIWP